MLKQQCIHRTAVLRCAVLSVQADLSTTLRCAGGWVRDKLMGRSSLVSAVVLQWLQITGFGGGWMHGSSCEGHRLDWSADVVAAHWQLDIDIALDTPARPPFCCAL